MSNRGWSHRTQLPGHGGRRLAGLGATLQAVRLHTTTLLHDELAFIWRPDSMSASSNAID